MPWKYFDCIPVTQTNVNENILKMLFLAYVVFFLIVIWSLQMNIFLWQCWNDLIALLQLKQFIVNRLIWNCCMSLCHFNLQYELQDQLIQTKLVFWLQ